MDLTASRDWPGFVVCDDLTGLGETLGGMTTIGVDAVVVRNGGPPGETAVAEFAEALVAGAREAQNTLGTARRIR